MYHISIYFDTKTENRIREYIKRVAEKSGNEYMLEANVPPHITISAFEVENEDEVIHCLERLVNGSNIVGDAAVGGKSLKLGAGYDGVADLKQGKLQWVSVGVFLPGVIYLQPVLNEYLQELSEQVYDCIKNVANVNIRPCYRPFSWVPHSTIGKKLSVREMQSAFEVLQGSFRVFEGKAVRVGLAKMNPHREIASWKLNV